MFVSDQTHGSEYSRDFCRPHTAEAVKRLDPQLELVFNRKYGLFQVIRHTLVAVHYEVPGLGDLLCLDRFEFWESDVLERHQVEQEDNPYLLIESMKEGDTKEKPELLNDSWRLEGLLEYRSQMEEKVREGTEYCKRFNRAQVLRAWQPFFDWTGLVR